MKTLTYSLFFKSLNLVIEVAKDNFKSVEALPKSG